MFHFLYIDMFEIWRKSQLNLKFNFIYIPSGFSRLAHLAYPYFNENAIAIFAMSSYAKWTYCCEISTLSTVIDSVPSSIYTTRVSSINNFWIDE